jgi:hypothetical protein
MSTTTLAQLTGGAGAARSRRLAAALFAPLRRAGVLLWRGLEAHGRATAMRELARLHDRWEFHEPKYNAHVRDAHGIPRRRGRAAPGLTLGPSAQRSGRIELATT